MRFLQLKVFSEAVELVAIASRANRRSCHHSAGSRPNTPSSYRYRPTRPSHGPTKRLRPRSRRQPYAQKSSISLILKHPQTLTACPSSRLPNEASSIPQVPKPASPPPHTDPLRTYHTYHPPNPTHNPSTHNASPAKKATTTQHAHAIPSRPPQRHPSTSDEALPKRPSRPRPARQPRAGPKRRASQSLTKAPGAGARG